MDPYKVLDVEPTATIEEIRLAYKRLARQFHPDVSTEPDHEQRIKEINAAWEILGSEDRRAKFDSTGSTGQERTIDEEALDHLTRLLASALDNNVPDPVEAANHLIVINLAQSHEGTANLKKRMVALEAYSRRIRSKTKGDQHVVAALIADRIKVCQKGLEQNARGREVLTHAQLLLTDLEFVADTVVNPESTIISSIAFNPQIFTIRYSNTK